MLNFTGDAESVVLIEGVGVGRPSCSVCGCFAAGFWARTGERRTVPAKARALRLRRSFIGWDLLDARKYIVPEMRCEIEGSRVIWLGCVPPPPSLVFGNKPFGMSDLRISTVCKTLIPEILRVKSLNQQLAVNFGYSRVFSGTPPLQCTKSAGVIAPRCLAWALWRVFDDLCRASAVAPWVWAGDGWVFGVSHHDSGLKVLVTAWWGGGFF